MTPPVPRKRFTVLDYPDGRFAIGYEGQDLPYRPFDRLQKVDGRLLPGAVPIDEFSLETDGARPRVPLRA